MLLLAALVLIVLEPVVLPAQGQAVRKQIKLARRDLVAFEKEVEAIVESLEQLQAEEVELSEDMKSIRKVLRKLDDADTLYERWRSALFGSLLADSLEDIKARRDIVSALVPQLRRHIWEKGLERKEKINTLQDAIELLQSARAGDLITKAGVGGGQLITYSADWAAVAMCESSGRWHIDDYFDGGLQFLPSTWWGFGGGQYGHYRVPGHSPATDRYRRAGPRRSGSQCVAQLFRRSARRHGRVDQATGSPGSAPSSTFSKRTIPSSSIPPSTRNSLVNPAMRLEPRLMAPTTNRPLSSSFV